MSITLWGNKIFTCPLCGKPTIQVLGATAKQDEQGHLVLRCMDCWDKMKKEVK